MNTISKLFAVSALAILILAAGCGDDNGGGPSNANKYNALTLDLYDSGHLDNGYFYQIWVANTGSKSAASTALDWVSVVEFNVNPVAGGATPDDITTITGQAVKDNTFANLSEDFEARDTLIITIEAPGASSGVPSTTVVAEAQIPDDFEQHTIGILRFPVDVDTNLSVPNSFELATPTDADTSNELSGIWFARNVESGPSQSLRLKTAPTGWIYEGWAWHDDTWLSTGKFESAAQADEFSGYSAGAGIGFPGEDFLMNAPAGVTFPWTFGIGDTILITLEPSPDPAPDVPSFVRVYGLGMADARPPHVATQLVTPVQLEPNGTVTFKRSDDL